jgi:hypothetical protein
MKRIKEIDEFNSELLQFACSERLGLPFRSIGSFDRAALDEWQDLFRQFAEEVWSPERLEVEA